MEHSEHVMEEENYDSNIEDIAKNGDLSPGNIEGLKSETKRS